jgi:hypothetical protein
MPTRSYPQNSVEQSDYLHPYTVVFVDPSDHLTEHGSYSSKAAAAGKVRALVRAWRAHGRHPQAQQGAAGAWPRWRPTTTGYTARVHETDLDHPGHPLVFRCQTAYTPWAALRYRGREEVGYLAVADRGFSGTAPVRTRRAARAARAKALAEAEAAVLVTWTEAERQRARRSGFADEAPLLLLTTELVPRPCFYANLRGRMRPADWTRLARSVVELQDYRCAVCQEPGQGRGPQRGLQCHEHWVYDDARGVQRLGCFLALCVWCHRVKPLGHAGLLAGAGKLDYARVVQQFLRVNRCTLAAFEAVSRASAEEWQERSEREWTTDLDEWAALVAGSAGPA